MRRMKAFFPIALVLILFASCEKNNPDPVWIEINKWELEANPNLANEPSVLFHKITDAWVYVDGDLMGVFELPVKIPVLKEGLMKIRILPAVKNNGISATKKIYPFLVAYEETVNLQKNELATISPVTHYKDGCKFWLEDFEDPTFDVASGTNSLTDMTKESDPSVIDPTINEGAFGRITLNTAQNTYTGSTTANAFGTLNMPLPKGTDVYLEIDYHTTNNLVTGVLAISSNGITDNVNVQINAQKDGPFWNKIYIQVDEIVSMSTSAERFEFSFNAVLDEGDTQGEINIDNIKAVYF